MPLLTLLNPKGTVDDPYVPPTVGRPADPVLIPALRVQVRYYDPSSSVKFLTADVSSMCRSVMVTRGRSSRDGGGADPGSMTIVLDDPRGLLDPENQNGQVAGLLSPGGGPTATSFIVDHLFEGSYRPLGWGFLTSIDRTWGPAGPWSQSVVTTVDFSTEFARLVAEEGRRLPRQTASQRIDAFTSLPSRSRERFTPGSMRLQNSSRQLGPLTTDGGTSHWDYMQQAAASDDGLLFFDGAGRFVYQSGAYRANRPVTATLGDADNEVTVQPDLTYRLSSDDVVYEAAFTTWDGQITAATSAGGTFVFGQPTPVRAEDGSLIADPVRYFKLPRPPGTATQLADAAQVSARARSVHRRDSVPRRGVEQVSLDVLSAYHDFSTASPYRFALGVEVSDRVKLNRRPPGGGTVLTADYFVESITHTIEAGRAWDTTLRLSKALEPTTTWRLGRDPFGFSIRFGIW
jgi:hypothetical protein